MEIPSKNEVALNRLNGFDSSEDMEMDWLDKEYAISTSIGVTGQVLSGKKSVAKGSFKNIKPVGLSKTITDQNSPVEMFEGN